MSAPLPDTAAVVCRMARAAQALPVPANWRTVLADTLALAEQALARWSEKVEDARTFAEMVPHWADRLAAAHAILDATVSPVTNGKASDRRWPGALPCPAARRAPAGHQMVQITFWRDVLITLQGLRWDSRALGPLAHQPAALYGCPLCGRWGLYTPEGAPLDLPAGAAEDLLIAAAKKKGVFRA